MMPDREKVIADIEEQMAWIRDNDFHKFPGWGHTVLAMKDALVLLKEQEEQKRKWLQNIADNQFSISGVDPLTEYEQGKWDGLQMAFEILTEEKGALMKVVLKRDLKATLEKERKHQRGVLQNMKEYKVPIQSLIDHIKTACDVDPWAKEMAEELLKEREAMEQCIKKKCIICPNCQNCDADEMGQLKEQEAVKPKSKVRHGANAQIQHFCGRCNAMLHGKPKFCSECGRPVKWE